MKCVSAHKFLKSSRLMTFPHHFCLCGGFHFTPLALAISCASVRNGNTRAHCLFAGFPVAFVKSLPVQKIAVCSASLACSAWKSLAHEAKLAPGAPTRLITERDAWPSRRRRFGGLPGLAVVDRNVNLKNAFHRCHQKYLFLLRLSATRILSTGLGDCSFKCSYL